MIANGTCLLERIEKEDSFIRLLINKDIELTEDMILTVILSSEKDPIFSKKFNNEINLELALLLAKENFRTNIKKDIFSITFSQGIYIFKIFKMDNVNIFIGYLLEKNYTNRLSLMQSQMHYIRNIIL